MYLLSNDCERIYVDDSNPILNNGYFNLIDKDQNTGFNTELLKLIFDDDYNVDYENLIKYIPIMSSLSLDSKVKDCYLKLFTLMNEYDQWNDIDDLMDDMNNYFTIDEINKMPEKIALKLIIHNENQILDIQKIF